MIDATEYPLPDLTPTPAGIQIVQRIVDDAENRHRDVGVGSSKPWIHSVVSQS